MVFNPINKSKKSSWVFQIHNDLLSIEFYVTGMSLPGVSVGLTRVNAPTLEYNEPSNTLSFEPYSLNILSDEGLDIYTSIFNMITQTTTKAGEPYCDTVSPKFEGTLYVLSNKGTPIKKVVYHDSWISSLSPYEFSIEDGDNQLFSADVQYTYYEILDINEYTTS